MLIINHAIAIWRRNVHIFNGLLDSLHVRLTSVGDNHFINIIVEIVQAMNISGDYNTKGQY